jgi:hypothetical protein
MQFHSHRELVAQNAISTSLLLLCSNAPAIAAGILHLPKIVLRFAHSIVLLWALSMVMAISMPDTSWRLLAVTVASHLAHVSLLNVQKGYHCLPDEIISILIRICFRKTYFQATNCTSSSWSSMKTS